MPPTTPSPTDWGKRVTAAREAAGLSKAELARATEVHPATISRIEGGQFTPTDVLRIRLAVALKTSVTALFPYPDVAA